MKYDSRMGISYDTLFYSALCFNFDKFKKDYLEKHGVTEEDFSLYYHLKESISTPPPELYPFFYCDLLKPCFLSKRHFYDFRFGQEDFIPFLSRIETDPSFRQSVFEYYVGPFTGTPTWDNIELVKQILQIDADRELILQLINLLTSFESVLQTLLSFLKKTYYAVVDLYAQNKAYIQNLVHDYKTDEFFDALLLQEPFKHFRKNKKCSLAISLLNISIILQKGTFETGYKFIFGCKCFLSFDRLDFCRKIPPQELCEALGNPIKHSILLQLKDKEATATQLSDILMYSRQTVNRHLLWLYHNWLISYSKTKGTGPEVYYQLNPNFVSLIKKGFTKYIELFETESIGEKREDQEEAIDNTNS